MAETNKLVTPVFRGSFPHLAKARAMPNQPESTAKYSIDILLEKSNPEHMAFLKKMKKAAAAACTAKWGDKVPRGLKLPFRDGDEKDRDELQGHYFLTAKASLDYRPQVLNNDLHPIPLEEIQAECYAGAWYRASLSCYAWGPNIGGCGVSFGLNSVKKVRDDESFGGGAGNAVADFAPFEDEDGGDSSSDFGPDVDDDEADEEPTPPPAKTKGKGKAKPAPVDDLDDLDDDDL